jgi:hypothetical protein
MIMKKYALKFSLNSVTCHDVGALGGNVRPYLWTMLFAIDGQGVKIKPDFTLEGSGFFQYSYGSHGNLQVDKVVSGKHISIPAGLVTYRMELSPVGVPYFKQQLPGMVCLVSVLMAENNITEKGAEAGREALFHLIKDGVQKGIREFDPKEVDIYNLVDSIKAYFNRALEKQAKGMVQAIGKAIKSNQSLVQNIWSSFSKDDYLGFASWTFSTDDLESNDHQILFSKKWETLKHGIWEFSGDLISELVLPTGQETKPTEKEKSIKPASEEEYDFLGV